MYKKSVSVSEGPANVGEVLIKDYEETWLMFYISKRSELDLVNFI